MLGFLAIGKWFAIAKPLLLGGAIISAVLGFHGWVGGKVDKEVAAELIKRTHKQAVQKTREVEIQNRQALEALKQESIRANEALEKKAQEAERLRYVANKQLAILERERKERSGLRECLNFELDAGILQLYQARNDHSD